MKPDLDNYDRKNTWLWALLAAASVVGLIFIWDFVHDTRTDLKNQANSIQSQQNQLERAVFRIESDRAKRLGEAEDRQDEDCTINERAHKKNVDDLKDTYNILIKATPDQLVNDFVLSAIITQLPKIEEEARFDQAPDYCDTDKPNGESYGLDEPDPVIPCRPKELGPDPNPPKKCQPLGK